MLSCRPIIDSMTTYLEGKLGLLARIGFAIHIRTCWQCRQYLEQLKAVVKAVARLPSPLDAPPPGLLATIRAQLPPPSSGGGPQRSP